MNKFLNESYLNLANANFPKHQFTHRLSKYKKLKYKLKGFLRTRGYFVPKVNLENETKKISKNIILDFQKIKFTNNFDKEIEKSLLRLELRYKSEYLLLISKLAKQVIEDNSNPFKLCKFNYISLSLPIIHFPYDFSEAGTLHNDYVACHEDGMRIAWLPYTDYKYPGVITKSKLIRWITHLIGKRIGTKLFLNFPDIPIRKNHKSGEWLMWNDTFIHRGIVNSSDTISIALIIRFSNNFNRETFIQLKDIIDYEKNFNKNKNLFNDKIVDHAKDISRELVKGIESLNKVNLKSKSIAFLQKVLNKYEANEDRLLILNMIDFSLDLLSDRFIANPSLDWFNKNNFIHSDICDKLSILRDSIEDLNFGKSH